MNKQLVNISMVPAYKDNSDIFMFFTHRMFVLFLSSMSMYSHGRMYWFYRDTRIGYNAHDFVSSRCPVPVEKFTFSVKPKSQELNVKAIMIKTNYTYSNSRFV